ncbi:MAG: translation elongation factor Ts [Alkalispirochaeta sp.]
MAVTAADVKKLREKTGAGMMDCKKALQEAEGDFAKAERILKELGKAAAAKRSGRATNEGRVFVKIDGNRAVILEMACETDFVARNETFVALGQELTGDILDRNLADADETLNAKVQDAISTIKENMSLRRFQVITKTDNQVFSSYIHGESGGIGGIVTVGVDKPELTDSQQVKDFAFDVALHVVAFRPAYLAPENIDQAYRTEQEEIFLTQAKNMDKPEKVIQGIVQGKLRKHFSEICLLEQGFVKDEKKPVKDVAKEVGNAAGGTVTVDDYVVYAVGEDL